MRQSSPEGRCKAYLDTSRKIDRSEHEKTVQACVDLNFPSLWTHLVMLSLVAQVRNPHILSATLTSTTLPTTRSPTSGIYLRIRQTQEGVARRTLPRFKCFYSHEFIHTRNHSSKGRNHFFILNVRPMPPFIIVNINSTSN